MVVLAYFDIYIITNEGSIFDLSFTLEKRRWLVSSSNDRKNKGEMLEYR